MHSRNSTPSRRLWSALALTGATLLTLGSIALAQVNVTTQRNNNQRTGANLNETILNSANVNQNTFGRIFYRTVDGEIYAQPLVVSGVAVPEKGNRNVVYVATMNNSLYAFDAEAPLESTPLWKVNFGSAVPIADVQCNGQSISTRVGILGTPVIDAANNRMFLVAHLKLNSTTYRHRILVVDIRSGAILATKDIAATVGGIIFNSRVQSQRPALLLEGDFLAIGFGSFSQCGDYRGWTFLYNPNTLAITSAFLHAPAKGGGVEQSGQGPASDGNDGIHVVTGVGAFDKGSPPSNFGESFLRINTGRTFPAITSFFTPFNVDTLNTNGINVGSTGPLVIPGATRVVGGTEAGLLHVLNSTGLGGYNAVSNGNSVQTFQATPKGLFGLPVFYNSPGFGQSAYLWGAEDTLRVYSFNGSLFNTTPVAFSTAVAPTGNPGGILSLSANASTAGTGVLWATHPFDSDASNARVLGILRAYDANTTDTDINGVARLRELWNSRLDLARDDLGNFAKFTPPTIANGKVYMATFGARGTPLGSGRLVVYGLVPTTPLPAPTRLVGTPGAGQVQLKWDASPEGFFYHVYRSETQGVFTDVPYAKTNSVIYLDTKVKNNKTYYYRVTVINLGYVESPPSNEVGVRPSTLIRIVANQDAYTKSTEADRNTNFGRLTELYAQEGGTADTRYIYLRFDITKYITTLKRATVRLYGGRRDSTEPVNLSIYGVENVGWGESTITFANQPALGAKLRTIPVDGTLKYWEWDVTSYIQQQKAARKSFVTFAIKADSAAIDMLPAIFNAREVVGALKPDLQLSLTNYPYYPTFTGALNLTLNGAAALLGNLLSLTSDMPNQTSSVFYKTQVSVTGFSNTFRFKITNPNAEGFTFVVTRSNDRSLGTGGGGLGYGLEPATGVGVRILRSVAIKFDIANSAGEGSNSTGLYINGDAPGSPATDLTAAGIDLKSGHIFEVGMVYRLGVLTVTIKDQLTKVVATQIYNIDIPGTLRDTYGLFGFTGATGAEMSSSIEIQRWLMGGL